MATADELLAAVMAAADDDAPRLVYADWLTERGDARGEFISVQCALAGATPRRAVRRRTRDAGALERRERELLAAHESEWLRGLEWLHKVGWRRGFPHVGECAARVWSEHAGALAAVPLAALRLTDVEARVGAPADHPTLRALTLSTRQPPATMATVAAALPRWATRLCFASEIDDATAAALARGDLTRWTHLGVRAWSWDVTPRLLDCLEGAGALAHLELPGISLGEHAWRRLARMALPQLRTLIVSAAVWASLAPETQALLSARFELRLDAERGQDVFA